jgi:hypothetical protein
MLQQMVWMPSTKAAPDQEPELTPELTSAQRRVFKNQLGSSKQCGEVAEPG